MITESRSKGHGSRVRPTRHREMEDEFWKNAGPQGKKSRTHGILVGLKRSLSRTLDLEFQSPNPKL
jgi:hypothetical protein